MTCNELRDLHELYALGLLDADEREQVEEHLGRNCQACTASLKRAMETNVLLASSVPLVDPPARLRKRVLASVGEATESNWAWTFTWAAACAVLLAAVLWYSIRDRRFAQEIADARRQVEQSGTTAQRLEQALAFLNQPDTQVLVTGRSVPLPPRARVFLNPNQGVLLLAASLPPAPSGKIYELWVLPKTGAPRPAGLFNSDANGNAVHVQPGPLDLGAMTGVAVTVEPEQGSPAPTTTPIIVVGL